jgi:hypothetical protein
MPAGIKAKSRFVLTARLLAELLESIHCGVESRPWVFALERFGRCRFTEGLRKDQSSVIDCFVVTITV